MVPTPVDDGSAAGLADSGSENLQKSQAGNNSGAAQGSSSVTAAAGAGPTSASAGIDAAVADKPALPAREQEEPLKRMAKIVSVFLARPDSGPFREPVNWRELELWDYPEVVKKPQDLGTIHSKLQKNLYPTAAACAADIRLVWKNCMTYNAEGSDFWLLAKAFSKRFEDRYRRIRADFDVGEAPVEQEEAEENEKQEEEHDERDDEEMEEVEESDGQGESGESDDNGGEEDEYVGGENEKNKGKNKKKGSKADKTKERVKDAQKKKKAAALRQSSGAASAASTTSSPQQPSVGSNQPTGPSLDARARFASNLLFLNGPELGHVITTIEQKCPQALEHLDEGENETKIPKQPMPGKMEIIVDNIEAKVFSTLSQYAAEKAAARKRGLAAVAAEKSEKSAAAAAATAAAAAAATAAVGAPAAALVAEAATTNTGNNALSGTNEVPATEAVTNNSNNNNKRRRTK